MDNVLKDSSVVTPVSGDSSGWYDLGFTIYPSNCASYSHRLEDSRSGRRTVRPATKQEVEMWYALKKITEQLKIEQARLEGSAMELSA